MDSSEEINSITESLEICAERAGDVVPTLFAQWFSRDDAAAALMSHSDQHMQGRMFEGVMDLLMSDDHLRPGGYLDWELDNHIDAYAATPSMYQSFFESLVATVREAAGDDWQSHFEAAWQSRVARIMAQVEAHPTPT